MVESYENCFHMTMVNGNLSVDTLARIIIFLLNQRSDENGRQLEMIHTTIQDRIILTVSNMYLLTRQSKNLRKWSSVKVQSYGAALY